jgi:ankyrin repeat protein
MCEFCPRYGNRFVEACFNGDLDEVKLALEEGVDVNAFDEQYDDTPLRVACYKACEEELLYEAHREELPITFFENYVNIIKLLLDKGADVNFGGDSDKFVLIEASEEGAIEIVRLLLAYGADVNIIGIDGDTALMVACRHGHFEIIKLLLEHGADRYIDNNDGKDALRIAKDLGDAAIIELLSNKDVVKS